VSQFATIAACAALLFAREARADVDGLGVLAIESQKELFVDAAFEHADGADELALVPGARIRIGTLGFLEGRLPVGYGIQPGAAALGNVMAGLGLLPRDHRLVGLALRFTAPTSPRLGDGMTTVAALAAPRLSDPELFLPHTISAELVADLRWRGDTSWVQAEGGVAGWWQPSPLGFSTVLRASVAGGVRVERWLDLTASFVTRVFVRDQPEHFVHALLLGIVAHDGRGQITIRLEVPIDDSARDQNRFLAGLEFRGH
jgi:hypothetical protein